MAFAKTKTSALASLSSLTLFIITFLALFSSSGNAFAFTEYSYLLKSGSPDAFNYLVHARSCDGFLQSFSLPKTLAATKEFAPVVQSGENAQAALSNALVIALIQKSFIAPSSFFSFNWFSYQCFGEGAVALGESVQAVKNGFAAVDENIAELEQMTLDEYTGTAGGVLQELKEVKQDIDARETRGEAFGKAFSRAVQETTAEWNAFEFAQASSDELLQASNRLIGDRGDSLLTQLISLNERVKNGIASLKEENDGLEEQVRALAFENERALGVLDGEKLSLVGENAFQLIGVGAGLSSEYRIASFEEDLRSARDGITDANRALDEAQRLWKTRDKGFASKSIELLRNTLENQAGVKASIKSIGDRSEVLENALRQRVLVEQQELKKAIDAVRESNPYAAASAQAFLDKDYAALVMPLKTRGERIAFYLEEVTQLLDLQKLAKSPVYVKDEKASALAEASALEKMIDEAKRDELDVEYESRQLKSIQDALAAIGGDAKSAQMLFVLKNDLLSLRQGIIAQATEKYGALLGAYFKKVSSLKEFLSDKQQMELASFDNYFDAFNELKAGEALGSLKSMRDFFEKTLADLDLRLPDVLRKHLEETAVLQFEWGETRLNEPTRVTARLSLKNGLDLGYDKPLSVNVPALTEVLGSRAYKVVAKSPEATDSPNGVLLSSVEAGGEYFLEIEYDETIARGVSETDETLYATETKAFLKKTIEFESKQDAVVAVEETLDFPASLSRAGAVGSARIISSSASRAGEKTVLRALVDARKGGGNEVFFEYEVREPISVEESASTSGNVVRFDLTMVNKFVALDGASIAFAKSLDCTPKKIDVIAGPGIQHQQEFEAGLLAATFSAAHLNAGQSEKASIVVECDSLEQAAKTKLDEVTAAAQALEGGVARAAIEEKIDAATQAIEDKKFGDALKLLVDAQEIAGGEQEKALAENQLKQDYQSELANALSLIAGLQNASSELLAQGNAEESSALQQTIDAGTKQIDDASRAFEEKDFGNALNKLRAASAGLENALEKIARDKLAALQKQCVAAGGDCPVEASGLLKKAFGALAVRDFIQAIAWGEQAGSLLGAEAGALQSNRDAKKALMQDYPALKKGVGESEAAFGTAFEVGQEFVFEQRRSLAFQQGTAAQKTADQLVKKLDAAWSDFETGDEAFAKYSLAFLNESLAELARAQDVLDEKTLDARREAEGELAVAEQRVKEFGGGDAAAQDSLVQAKQFFDDGHFFAAFSAASVLNHALAGVSQEKPGAGTAFAVAGSGQLWLGVAGLVILAVLVYFIVFREKPVARKEI